MSSPATVEVRGPLGGGWPLLVPMVLLAATADLWAPDEPRYAEVAREAWSGGGLLVMHLNGALYPDKPPLLYWLAGAFGKLAGWSELALRIPSLLATAGTAWLVGRLARRFWGELEARWAATFWLGTAMVLYIGGRLQIDPLLAFLCLAALDLFSAPAASTRAVLGAGLCLGLAALAKGPVAWAHFAFALLAWRLLPGAARLRPRRSVQEWGLFVALAVLPVVAWATAASIAEPALARALFYGQHLGRVTAGRDHPGPPWYHLERMPVQMLPWTLLFAAALASAWRAWKAARRGDACDAGTLRAASWLLLTFAFFSIIPSKRELYLLPVYPAAALLCAREVARMQRAGRLPGWIGWGTVGAMLAAGLGLVLAVPITRRTGSLGSDAEAIARLAPWVGAPLVLAAACAAASVLRSDVRGFAQRITWGLAGAGAALALLVAPALNPVKSAREIGRYLADRPEKPAEIPCVGVKPEGYRFYGGVPTVVGELLPALEREGARFLGLVNRPDWERLEPELRARFAILREGGVGGRTVLVLGAASEHALGR